MFVVFIFMLFTVISISLFVMIVNYHIIIEDIISEISVRVEKRANIYEYTDIDDLKKIFESIKEDLKLDLDENYGESFKFHKENINKIIDNINLSETVISEENKSNEIHNHLIFSINLNTEEKNCEIELIFFKYTPVKYSYIILKKYGEY